MLTFQALSEEDRKSWMDVMDGKEPVTIEQLGLTLGKRGVMHVCKVLSHLCSWHRKVRDDTFQVTGFSLRRDFFSMKNATHAESVITDKPL